MAKFKFRLQSVLSYKEQVEEALKMELAQLQEAHQRELLALQELEGEKAHTARALQREEEREQLDLAAIELHVAYLDILEEAIVSQTSLVQELEERLTRKREEVIVAMQERKALEKLRDREAWRAALEERRMEGKLIDEVATARFGRERSIL